MSNRIFILNRSVPIATGGWIHIVPMGELPNADAGVTQVLDDTSMDSILANWAADKARLGDKWPGVYGGEEHFIYQDDQSSAAFAWFKDFEKRGDGIWASDEGLTDLGRQAVQNQRYKFTSFCADPSDVQPLGDNRVRILAVETIGFTNQANGKELLTPITNRGYCAGDVKARDEAIVTRAVEIVSEKPGTTLLAALDLAREEMPAPSTAPGSPEYIALAEKLGKRALEIMRENPVTRPHGAVKQAQNEMAAAAVPVTNRASAFGQFKNRMTSIRQAQKCTNGEAFLLARREHPDLYAQMGNGGAGGVISNRSKNQPEPIMANSSQSADDKTKVHQALTDFQSKVQQIMRERNWDFDKAYNFAKTKFPDVWRAAQDTAPPMMPLADILADGKMRNRKKAASKFTGEVIMLQNRLKCDFQTAWNKTRAKEPELFKAMSEQ